MWGTAKLQLMSGFLNPSQIFSHRDLPFREESGASVGAASSQSQDLLLGGGQSPRAGTACRQELSQEIPH